MAERSPWTKGVKAAWSYISGAVERGIAPNAAASQGRELGYVYRRTNFLAAYREIAGIPRSRSIIASTPLRAHLGRSAFQDTTLPMDETYEYLAQYTIRNTLTGDVRTGRFPVTSGQRLTKREHWDETMIQVVKLYPLREEEEFEKVETLSAFHRAGDPW